MLANCPSVPHALKKQWQSQELNWKKLIDTDKGQIDVISEQSPYETLILEERELYLLLPYIYISNPRFVLTRRESFLNKLAGFWWQ